MSAYQRPRQRKGFVLTYVAWGRDGSVRSTTYEPIRKARAEPAAPAQIGKRRSIIATEMESAPDLFGPR